MTAQKIKNFLFTNQATAQIITKNTFWLFLGNISTRFIRAIIIIYAARILGVEQYGIFSYFLSLTMIFTIITDLGLNSIFTREVAKNHQKEDEYFSTIFILKIILIILSAFIIFVISPFFIKVEAVKQFLFLGLILIIFDTFRDFASAYFRAKEKMELDALIISISNLSITFFSFWALYFSPTTKNLIISYTLSDGLGTLFAFFILRKKLKIIFENFNKKIIKPIFQNALMIFLILVIGIFLSQSDILMLGYLKTEKEIGLYAASQKIILVLYSFGAIISGAIFPTLNRFLKTSQEKIKNILEKSIIASLMLALPLTLGGITLAKDIIDFIYTPDYLKTINVFKILIFTTIFAFLSNVLGVYLIALEKQKKIALLAFLTAILNIILNFLLIKKFEIMGAAFATLISQIIYTTSLWFVCKKTQYFPLNFNLNKTISASVIMTGFIILFKILDIHLLLNISLSAIIYFGLLIFIFKESILREIFELIKK